MKTIESLGCGQYSQHVFYRVKNHSATPRGFKPNKTLLLVFSTLLNYCTKLNNIFSSNRYRYLDIRKRKFLV